MTLQHFYSDWDGLKSNTPYMRQPTRSELKQAVKHGKTITNDIKVFNRDNIIEVRANIDNNLTNNAYRDMYRIINSKDN